MPELFKRSGYHTVLIGKISHTADGRVYAYNGAGDGRDEVPNAWTEMSTPYGTWKRGWGIFFAYANGIHREDGSGAKDLFDFTVEGDESDSVDDVGYSREDEAPELNVRIDDANDNEDNSVQLRGVNQNGASLFSDRARLAKGTLRAVNAGDIPVAVGSSAGQPSQPGGRAGAYSRERDDVIVERRSAGANRGSPGGRDCPPSEGRVRRGERRL